MKFLNLLAIVSSVSAVALPPRKQTVISTVGDTVKTLEEAVATNLGAINEAVDGVTDNINATVKVHIEALINANLEAIAQALGEATGTIASVTTGAVGGVLAGVKGLTQQEVDQLAETIVTAKDIIDNLGASVELAVTDLTPDLLTAIHGELKAVRNALGPFLKPLMTFATAVRNAGVALKINVTGLNNALKGLLTIVKGLTDSLGLQALDGLFDALAALLGLKF